MVKSENRRKYIDFVKGDMMDLFRADIWAERVYFEKPLYEVI